MELADRIIMGIAGFLILLLALATLATILGGAFIDNFTLFLTYLRQDAKLGAGLVVVLFLLLSLYIFRLASRGRVQPSVLLKESELGDIRVSMDTIHQLAEEAIEHMDAIERSTVKVKTLSDELHVEVSLQVLPDILIPELCEGVQARLEDYLRSTAGITPKKVRVLVKEVRRSTSTKRRED